MSTATILARRDVLTGDGLDTAMSTMVTAAEAPLADVRLPAEIRGAGLLLLLGLILLGPNDDGEAPIDESAHALLNDLKFGWS